MKMLRSAAAWLFLSALAAPAAAAGPSPLSMTIDRTPLAAGGPANICANVLGSAAGCQSIGTMSAAGQYTLPLNVVAPSLDMTHAQQSLTVTPYGSDALTSTMTAVMGVAAPSGYRKFLLTHSMRCAVDAGKALSAAIGCVTDFDDMETLPGALQTWAYNGSNVIRPGSIAAGLKSAIVMELNHNNFDADTGNQFGDPSGLYPSTPLIAGTAIGYKITAAALFGTDGQREFNRGIAFVGGTVTQCVFCGYNTGATSGVYFSGAVQYAVDLVDQTIGVPIRLANGATMVARNAAKTADYGLIGSDTSNRVILGQGSASVISLVPFTVAGAVQGASNLNPGSVVQIAAVDANDRINLGAGSKGLNAVVPLTLSGALQANSNTLPGTVLQVAAVDSGDRVNLGAGSQGLNAVVPLTISTSLVLPRSAWGSGTASGSPCVDTNGKFFIKTTSGACL